MLIVGAMGLIVGVILTWLGCAFAYKWRHIGKSWVFIIPETVGTTLTALRVKLTDGKFDIPSRNHDAVRGDSDRMLPQGNVAYQAKGDIKGPIHIMSSYGANLVAPTKLQAAEYMEKIAVADWLLDYKRQPKPGEEAFQVHLKNAWEKAKQFATHFLIWDPLAYFKACDENDMQDFLNSQGGSNDPWYAKAAFVGVLIVGCLLLILLAVIGLKVLPAIQGGAAAGR